MTDTRESAAEDRWEPLRFFLGDWTGAGTGRPGHSQVERSFRLTLADQFIEIRSRSLYEPQERNPAGEDHREIGLLGYDRERARYILREFHVEGFVLQYVLASPATDDAPCVWETEAIENMPPGWRARTTWEILAADSFRETFDLARPAEEWARYITTVLHRVP